MGLLHQTDKSMDLLHSQLQHLCNLTLISMYGEWTYFPRSTEKKSTSQEHNGNFENELIFSATLYHCEHLFPHKSTNSFISITDCWVLHFKEINFWHCYKRFITLRQCKVLHKMWHSESRWLKPLTSKRWLQQSEHTVLALVWSQAVKWTCQ